MTEIRWHHRLAAWLYLHLGQPLCNHATPVWMGEAYDGDDYEYEDTHTDDLDMAYDAGYEAAMEGRRWDE